MGTVTTYATPTTRAFVVIQVECLWEDGWATAVMRRVEEGEGVEFASFLDAVTYATQQAVEYGGDILRHEPATDTMFYRVYTWDSWTDCGRTYQVVPLG